MAGTSCSCELAASGGAGSVEGTKGYNGMPSDAPDLGMPGNAAMANSATIWPEDERKVLDKFPDRDPSWISAMDIILEEEEAWEKGPACVERDGSHFRATFSSVEEGEQTDRELPATSNAGTITRSGMGQDVQGDQDLQFGSMGGSRFTPDRAKRAGELHPASSPAGQQERDAVREHFRGRCIGNSGDLRSPSQPLWQPYSAVYSGLEARYEGERGRRSPKRRNRVEVHTIS